MLELKTKWFTNNIAKQAMLSNDFISCNNEKRLYVVGYGVLTNSGKNTYNVVLKDSEGKVLEEHSNLYIDAITKLILGSSPKAKANKDANESEANKTKDVSLVSEFKKLKSNLAKAIDALNDFQQKYNVISLQDVATLEEKTTKKSEELKSLYQTLELAKAQKNTMLVDAISEMIANKEKE